MGTLFNFEIRYLLNIADYISIKPCFITKRERVFRDRTNPLDIYDDVELYDRFRLPRNSLINLINELRGELEHATRRQRAIPVELQVLVALRFLSSGSFQNLVGDMVNIDKTNACKIIRRVVLSLKLRLRQYSKFPTVLESSTL
ncbi:hypothetical protein KUTeg_003080 [Tegillarca granosa]|uniref:Nuclease HARBI1 n=1 Tax=Tegillarca granosa TaxID=220873 RepID=A0ABQ9FL31_TEGGR|nr:hypothetical protein KUTeg_003080 [Tegillarca granosa]